MMGAAGRNSCGRPGHPPLRAEVGTGPLRGRVTGSISSRPVPFALMSLDRPKLDFFGSEQGTFRAARTGAR